MPCGRGFVALGLGLLVTVSIGCGKASEKRPVAQEQPADAQSEAAKPAADNVAGGGADDAAGGPVELDRVTFTAPAGWVRKPASSNFVLAEFSLPRAEGDAEDARLTISVAGGSIEDNIDRWRGQFGGQPAKESTGTLTVDGIEVTMVDLAGDFNDQRGPFAPPAQRTGYRMLAGILPIEGELHFVKCTGPDKTVAAHADRITEFVRTAKKK